MELTQVEGNTVCLSGLFGPDLYGEYDDVNSCIVFASQDPYGSECYYFAKENWDADGKFVFNPEESVVAPIDAEGNISFDGWTIIYDYKTGSYFSYFNNVETRLLKEAPAADLDICGTYNVDVFSGWECYWFSGDYDWHTFSYNGYQVDISQVEGTTVMLTGLLTDQEALVGEYNAADNTIVFPTQTITIDGYEYFFTREQWDGNTIIVDPEASVVATVTEDGNIDFNGWTVVYPYGDGTYWTYFSGITVGLSSDYGEVVIKDVTEIVGDYTVEKFSGWEAYWFTTTDEDWHTFDYSGYTVNISQVEGNTVKLSNLLNSEDSFVGEFNPTKSCIVFDTQEVDIQGYKYILCKEQWNGDDIAVDWDGSINAPIASDGTITFSGWTLVYPFDDDTYWAYFSNVNTKLTRDASSVQNIFNDATVDPTAPVYYYNLNGMNVDGGNLAPGLYIIKQGTSTRKVLVK